MKPCTTAAGWRLCSSVRAPRFPAYSFADVLLLFTHFPSSASLTGKKESARNSKLIKLRFLLLSCRRWRRLLRTGSFLALAAGFRRCVASFRILAFVPFFRSLPFRSSVLKNDLAPRSCVRSCVSSSFSPRDGVCNPRCPCNSFPNVPNCRFVPCYRSNGAQAALSRKSSALVFNKCCVLRDSTPGSFFGSEISLTHMEMNWKILRARREILFDSFQLVAGPDLRLIVL